MEQTRRGDGHDAHENERGHGPRAANDTKKTSATMGEPRRRVNWLSISRTKWLRTSRECLDCWAL
jgi:hypothetical protein